jgi:hypothetical protein
MALVKTLHIASVVLWLGNFVLTGVWSTRAVTRGDLALCRFAAVEILFTDAAFTFVFGAGVVITGVLLAGMEHVTIFGTAWTREAIEIVAAATLIWLAILLPIEIFMLRAARAGTWSARLFAWWAGVGTLVTLALFWVIYLMVAKPV